ncbi:MAG: hypothetical protein CMP49_06715 [Flavobacteriales bacterium]|nr:hypothetical protein [Flavobacteriales bacterium]|tara:strand:+ start:15960 stop:17321 length:1362 start_codon:yes stop_codon:yes gene_type:complete
MRNLLVIFLFITSFLFAQDNYNTVSVGLSTGLISEMGSIEGYSVPVFNLDVSKQLTPGVSLLSDFMFGFSDGSGWHVNNENFWYDVNFHSVSMLLSLNLLNLGDIPRDNRKFAINLKGGLGFLGISGNNTNGEINQSMFSSSAVSIPTGLELRYKLSSNLQACASFNQVFPMGPGLDGIALKDENSGWDFGFKTMNIGVSYTFGKNESSMAWINPIDVVSTKVDIVQKEISTLSIDTDGDGVADKFDKDNNTPLGVAVDGSGQPLDVDADGIADYKDIDPFTSPGVAVDSSGRELDDDQDGVPNSMDEEPNSPIGCTVNFQGRQIVGKGAFLPTVYFDVASSEVSYSNYQRLATVASVLKANPGYKLRVIGFADSVGSTDSNYKLGLKRANAVIESLVNTFGIELERMIADSQGENNLLANEDQKMQFKVTSDGLTQTKNFKSLNRRVQFIIE